MNQVLMVSGIRTRLVWRHQMLRLLSFNLSDQAHRTFEHSLNPVAQTPGIGSGITLLCKVSLHRFSRICDSLEIKPWGFSKYPRFRQKIKPHEWGFSYIAAQHKSRCSLNHFNLSFFPPNRKFEPHYTELAAQGLWPAKNPRIKCKGVN
jgi:hypothetical protein